MKRGRGDEGAEAATGGNALVKIEAAVSAIVRHVAGWKDQCGCQYQLFKKVDKGANSLLLHLGAFDELQCSAVLQATSVTLPGDYVVSDFGGDVDKSALWFRIARGTVETAPKRVNFAPQEDDDVRFKIRVARPEDIDAVQAAVASITACQGHADWVVKELPATYAVRVRYVKTIPAAAILAASHYAGSKLDFAAKTLVCVVKKKVPDIVH
jgi:hypothetical protein